jgi:signal peptidase I
VTPAPKSALRNGVGLLVTVGVAIAFALIFQAAIAKPYEIPSGSMEPTLDIGQRVIVNRLAYELGSPKVGDIVVFHPPAGAPDNHCGVHKSPREACPAPTPGEADTNYIKRIVAGPGDTLSVKGGHPVVNGVEKTNEPYITPCGAAAACNMPRTIKIPPDHYFMMGDNRGASDDSRFWGPIPRSWIIGEAFATYWPPDRIGTL